MTQINIKNINITPVTGGGTVSFYPNTNGAPSVAVDSLFAVGTEDDQITFRDIDGKYSLYAKSAHLDYANFTNCHAVGPGIPFVSFSGVDGGGNENILFRAFDDQKVSGAISAKPKQGNGAINKPQS